MPRTRSGCCVVEPEILQRRLERLEEYLGILRRLSSRSLTEFVADPTLYGSAERFLQLAIQLVVDMGNHVVAAERLGRVQRTADVPHLLREHGLVDAELADKWTQMIGLRNLLAYGYMDIDRSKVFQILQTQLVDLEALQRLFARML